MMLYLFAGIPVTHYPSALAWYNQLLGQEPAFFPNDAEAAWEVGDHRYLYIEERTDRAGGAVVTLLVDDLDECTSQIAARGLKPIKEETYENGVRKVIYHDPEGNEIGFGRSPD